MSNPVLVGARYFGSHPFIRDQPLLLPAVEALATVAEDKHSCDMAPLRSAITFSLDLAEVSILTAGGASCLQSERIALSLANKDSLRWW